MFEKWKKSPLDRVLAISLGAGIALVAYWLSPKTVDFKAWQPLCEGALLRPPEFFFPGLYRLLAHGLTRLGGLAFTVKSMQVLGPLALGVVAYQSVMFTLDGLVPLLRVERIRPEFRAVMVPVLTAVGMGLFLMSRPVMHAAWVLTPSMLTLTLVFVTLGAFRNFFTRASLWQGYWGMFMAGVLSAESLAGVVLAACAVGVAYQVVKNDVDCRFVLSQPYVYHVAKWTFSVLYFLGAGLAVLANACFFCHHGGLWAEAFRGFLDLPEVNALAIMFGLVVAPLVVTLAMMPRSCDNDAYLPYVNGVLLLLVVVTSVLFCLLPETVAIDNECAKMLMLFAAAFATVAALLTLLVDVYCRVQTRYPKLMRVAFFRLVLVGLLIPIVLMAALDGARPLAVALDRCADEIVAETADSRRLFSDGAMDALLELKSALAGGSLHAHSMFGGRGEYAAKLRMRDVSGDDDLSMMRIGASVALASWVASSSPELALSAVQLGLEFWKRSGKAPPHAGGLVAQPSGCAPEELMRARAWADAFADAVLAGDYDGAYARCRERRLRESFDMVKWRISRMMELRAFECERQNDEKTARFLRKNVNLLDHKNASLTQLRRFMNLSWNQDNLQLTPRESLKVAMGRANFRAARPHAEAVLSTDPDDAAANFSLGMYYYGVRDFERAEQYLAKARKARPKDPAVINNLAIVHMCLKKLESAEQLALEALAIKPDAREINGTLSEIRRRARGE